MRTLKDLLNLGNEQLHFLSTSLKEFERGHFFEVKRISSTIRTLIHHTPNSHSLIHQLENHPDNKLNQSMTFCDRQGVPESLYEGAVLYLDCQVPIISLRDGEAFSQAFRFLKDKNHWWERMILKSSKDPETIWTRKKIILNYANKEGGSHVDPIIPLNFSEAENSLKYIDKDLEIGVGYIVAYEAGLTMIHSFNEFLLRINETSI